MQNTMGQVTTSALIRGVTSYISSYCISWVSGNVVMNMRRRLFGHMMGMPVAFFDQQSTGTLLSRITYDSEQVASSSSNWQTFRRLWPMIAPHKAGLIVSAVALVLNAAGDTLMLSLLKPLLDDGFGKADKSVLLWMPLAVMGLSAGQIPHARGRFAFVSARAAGRCRDCASK
ncbi:hypothetical protein CRX72_13325 [Pantoea sp. BRM17]|nr:hypothetical protein CRX72_13325 [Pantoea sp. BRM17]